MIRAGQFSSLVILLAVLFDLPTVAAKWLALLLWILEVPCFSISPDTAVLMTEGFRSFSWTLRENGITVPKLDHEVPSFHILSSILLSIVSFDTVRCQKLTASLNKPRFS
jgi:hypothetical protein